MSVSPSSSETPLEQEPPHVNMLVALRLRASFPRSLYPKTALLCTGCVCATSQVCLLRNQQLLLDCVCLFHVIPSLRSLHKTALYLQSLKTFFTSARFQFALRRSDSCCTTISCSFTSTSSSSLLALASACGHLVPGDVRVTCF